VDIDLSQILAPDTPVLEIVIRGTIVYLALFLLLRVTGKRQTGGMGVSDLLVIVLIADAAQNAMAGQYNSVSDGIVLVATIIFWAYALDWLGYHVPFVQRFVHPMPLLLIENGRTLPKNLRSELLTHEELMSELRAQGVDAISAVSRAYLEGNGQLTVIKQGGGSEPKPKKQMG
jgi:uncharacterized membrane protein YcaP (DUF421 family)